ncbi:MAG: SRPBCC family protein [Flavobacteriales bacterium]|nr:SRPBCC family protein [Flavobacteriales bacterium]
MKILKTTITLLLMVVSFGAFAKKDKPATMIKQEIIIDASIDKAWEVLGPQFGNAQIWASSIKHSEALNEESINGSNCTERGCSVAGMGEIKEVLLSYSPENHSISYEVKEGLPKMVRYASNNWQLIDLGNGKTKLISQIEMKTGGFMGWMMGGMMKKKMTKMSSEVVEEFKYYIENGSPHPRTIKSNAKS